MAEAAPRRVALFLDGTWNFINNNTNVWRLKSLCDQSPEQKVYYSVGVGTARGEAVTGGMFGIGINEEVIAAYEWLMENYSLHDRIFIFGFSRGAFTARSLAGFIAKCGLLEPGSPLSMDQLYARYRNGTAKSILALSNEDAAHLALEDRWLKKYSRPIPVWFQGVWDTVGTLGVPLPYFPRVSRSSFKFLEVDLRINQTHAYHALAIDEHRPSFKPTLWKKVANKIGENIPPRPFDHVEQRWFVGAHSNVGGGYESDLLAQTLLAWIAAKAQQHGLVLKCDIDIDAGAAQCRIRDSLAEMMHGVYRVLTLNHHYYRPIGSDPVEDATSITNTINESIDGSVFDRVRADVHYRPPNLAEWAKRRAVNVTAITGPVKAHNPAEAAP